VTVLRDDALTAAWFSAALWLSMMMLAFLIHVARKHGANGKSTNGNPKKLIIQITTVGDDVISETVKELKTALGGREQATYEIWVVTEATDHRAYPFVDRVVTVPASYQTTQRTKFKGRAHEFARLCRVNAGLSDYKVLYIDDDSVVSQAFLDECYRESFDLLQGTVTIGEPRGILSYLDGSARAMSCLSLCSFFQELSHHLWTHGEGFCIDEEVDRTVSWDHPGWYAEDLVYGALATRRMGFRMRSSYATVQTNSPIGIRQFITQRRRWFWAFAKSTYLLPVSARVEMWALSILGMVITPLAVAGMPLAILGVFHLPGALSIPSRILFGLWIGAWAFSGYYAQRTVRGIVIGAVSAMVAPIVGFAATLVGLLMGPVDTFEVLKRVDLGSA
jgi:Glycosyl transferase family group 2